MKNYTMIPEKAHVRDVRVSILKILISNRKKYFSANTVLHTTINFLSLTHLSLASLLWDIGKQYSPRCDATERGVPSGAILFA